MTQPTPTRRRDALFVAGVAAVLVFAAALRVPQLFQGPGYANHDEMMYVPKAVRYGGGDLNPHYFQNPPFMSYLMFAGLAVWYAAGRVFGEFAGPLDFKAQFLADGAPAFVAARVVVLVVASAGIAHVAWFARRLVVDGASDAARRAAGWAAALALAASSLHALKSATATNEMLVTVLYAATVHAAVRASLAPTVRSAAFAGALAGLTAGAKYTGALAAVPVAAAFLAAPGLRSAQRLRLLVASGAACVAAFLVACPWAVLDFRTFHAHVVDLFGQDDRFQDGNGWRRYLETAWSGGLGPLWCALFLVGAAAAVVRIARGPPADRASRVVVLAAILGLAAFLMTRERNSMGRYLLPAFPCCAALAAAESASFGGRWGPRVLLAGALAWAGVAATDFPSLWRAARRADPRDEMAAWMHEHVPDGAYVITDMHPPWLVDVRARKEFEGKAPPATWSRLVPAYRLTMAYPYFVGPIAAIEGTGVSAGDWPRIAGLGPAYALVSSASRDAFSYMPPADYPGDRWQKSVVASLELVHAAEGEDPARSVYLYKVPPGGRR